MDGPTLAGFNWYIYNIVGIPVLYLPTDAPVIAWSYNIAIATVNQIFQVVPSGTNPATQIIYIQMVYNLATHNLVSWAPDVTPTPNPPYKIDQNGNPIGYFQFLRQNYGLNSFLPGIVTATYDQGTGTTLEVPEGLKNLTIADLALTKTPWGRTYLGEAQKWNRPWGMS